MSLDSPRMAATPSQLANVLADKLIRAVLAEAEAGNSEGKRFIKEALE